MDNNAKMKTAYQITERNGKSYWNRIGVAFLNRDGSLNVKLDSIPSNFQFQLRDYEPADARERDDRRAAPLSPAAHAQMQLEPGALS